VSQFEKAMVVAKLKGARDRKRATGARVEGPKPYAEVNPEMVALAKKLYRSPRGRHRRSLRAIAQELAQAGYRSRTGTPYTASSVQRMIESPRRR
jgi:Recombinase